MSDKKEYILCAAIWYKDVKHKRSDRDVLNMHTPKNINKGVVISGHRHGNCIGVMLALTGLRTVTHATDATGESVQGFLTSKNRFVTREKAAKIAHDRGQIENKVQRLFSEDLY